MKRTRYTKETYETWEESNDRNNVSNDVNYSYGSDLGEAFRHPRVDDDEDVSTSTRNGYRPSDNGVLKVLACYIVLFGMFGMTVMISALANSRGSVQNIHIDTVSGDNNRFEFLQEH